MVIASVGRGPRLFLLLGVWLRRSQRDASVGEIFPGLRVEAQVDNLTLRTI